MRLINADRLKTCFQHEKPSKPIGLCYERIIDEQPTIEPEQNIIRCKDCKYWITDGCKEVGCLEDDFCSYAERREGDADAD